MRKTQWILSGVIAGLIIAQAGALEPSQANAIEQKIASEQLQEAMISLKSILRKSPKDEQARILLSRVYLDKGDYESAEKELERAKKLGIDQSHWAPLEAKIYLKKRQFDKVIDNFSSAHFDVDDITLSWVADLNLTVAEAMMAKGHLKPARDILKSVMTHHPSKTQTWLTLVKTYILEKNLTEAENLLQQMTNRKNHKVDTKFEAQAQVLRASIYRLKKDIDSARIAYLDAINLDDENLQARLGLTEVYLLLKDEGNFVKQSNLLFEKAPRNSQAMYYQALSLFSQNRISESNSILQKLTAFQTDNHAAQLLLGYGYYKQKRFEMAAKTLEHYIELVPSHHGAKAVLASIMLKLREPEKSIKLLEPIVENTPHYQWLSVLGYAYVLSGSLDKGIDLLERASALVPNDPAIKLELAASLIANQQTSKASKILDDLVENQDYAQAELLKIYVALKSNDVDEALVTAKQLVSQDVDNPIFQNSLGLALRADGQLQKAEEAFQKAIKQAPEFLTAINNLAKVYILEKKYKEAENVLEDAVKIQPNSIEVLTLKSQLALATKQPQLAYKWLQTSQFRNPESFTPIAALISFHLSQNELDKAYEQAKEGLLKFPKNIQAKHMLGQIALQSNRYQEALRLFEDLYDTNPENVQVLQGLARTQLALNQVTKAQSSLAKILKKEQKNLHALLMSADIALSHGQYKELESITLKIRDAYPDKAIGLKLAADAALGLGKLDESVNLYEQAYHQQPSGLFVKSLFRALKYTQQSDKGYEIMEQHLAKFAHDDETRQYLATEYLMNKNISKAKEHYGKVVEHNKEDYVSLNNLAHIYLQESELVKAEKLAAQAFESAPNVPEVADTYAWILIKKKQADKALPILREAINKQPNSLQLRYHKAVGLYELGENSKAMLELEKVINSDQNFPEKESAKALLQQLKRQG